MRCWSRNRRWRDDQGTCLPEMFLPCFAFLRAVGSIHVVRTRKSDAEWRNRSCERSVNTTQLPAITRYPQKPNRNVSQSVLLPPYPVYLYQRARRGTGVQTNGCNRLLTPEGVFSDRNHHLVPLAVQG